MKDNRQLFELILSLKRKCQAREEVIQQDLGISQAEFNGLIVLNDDEKIEGHIFAERMGLSPSRSSRVLSKLNTKTFVHTAFKPEDRRSVSIALTPEGESMRHQIFTRMQECESRICSGLDKCRIDEIKNALIFLEKAL
ncbi:winged helix-turn-helix transcriptional regulator [bacterium]|nr:winged helix-turn-helix transcriptional regulator [bacterium]